MKIGVIGAGRLGLAFALVCDKNGIPVIISDKNEKYLKNIKNGFFITNEPHVTELLMKKRFLEVADTNQEVIDNCDYIWTFVDTPSQHDGTYDVSKLWEIVNDFVKSFNNEKQVSGKTLVIGCTTNPGDTQKISDLLTQYGIKVVYNPEFVAQGEIIKGLEEAKTVLLGSNSQDDLKIIINLYRNICDSNITINVMSYSAAELTKISVNCFLTMKISYANMIGEIAIKSGLDNEVNSILKAVGSDHRIGNKFLKYGFGFGGPCLPRDNRALSVHAKKYNADSKISDLVDQMNIDHTNFLKEYYISKNPDKTIPFVMKHISYKKGTDILTDSQQYNLCLSLISEGYVVYVQEIEAVIDQFRNKDLNGLEQNLKFFKMGTNPQGYLIDL